MGIVSTVSEITEHLLFSRLISVWPWMKIKITMMHSGNWGSQHVKFDSCHFTGSEIWLVMDGQTDRTTHRLLGSSIDVNLCKVLGLSKQKHGNYETIVALYPLYQSAPRVTSNTTVKYGDEPWTGEEVVIDCLRSWWSVTWIIVNKDNSLNRQIIDDYNVLEERKKKNHFFLLR